MSLRPAPSAPPVPIRLDGTVRSGGRDLRLKRIVEAGIEDQNVGADFMVRDAREKRASHHEGTPGGQMMIGQPCDPPLPTRSAHIPIR